MAWSVPPDENALLLLVSRVRVLQDPLQCHLLCNLCYNSGLIGPHIEGTYYMVFDQGSNTAEW